MKVGLHVPHRPISIVAIELFTPLGFDGATTAAELAAGTQRFVETEIADLAGEPVRACRSIAVDQLIGTGADRSARIATLSAPALRAHLRSLGELELRGISTLPLLLALPEQDKEAPIELREIEKALRSVASESREHRLELGDNIFQHGRAGVFHALAKAAELLDANQYRAVVVGAVDSWCDPRSLEKLARTNRILGSRNSDGLLPGEAAGFMLVVRSDVRLPETIDRLELEAVSLGKEAHHFLQEAPNLADGLTQAFRAIRKHEIVGRARVRHLLSGQSSESYWAEELTRAYLRNAELMPEPFTTTRISDGLGDVGAAAGLVEARVALDLGQRFTEDSSPRLLSYAASDTGSIGAAVMRVRRTIQNPDADRRASKPTTAMMKPVLPTTIIRNVSVASFEEHAGEMGFLLAWRRTAYLNNPAASWLGMTSPEERIFRHLEAMEAWGPPALKWLREDGFQSSDEEILRGSTFALASLGEVAQANAALLKRLTATPEQDELDAIRDALILARRPGLGSVLQPLLTADKSEVRAFAAEVMGYRREGSPEQIRDLLREPANSPQKEVEAAATALARLGFTASRARIAQALAAIKSAPLLEAAARLGDVHALELARQMIEAGETVDPEIILVLGLAGEASDSEVIARRWPTSSKARQAACVALGALGARSAFSKLLESLSDDDDQVRASAGEALARITGAPLREQVFVEDTLAEDPTVGELVERPSTRLIDWENFLRDHNALHRAGSRCRLGKSFTLLQCLDEAESPLQPQRLRELALREFQLRGRVSLSTEPDAFVVDQKLAFSRARAG